MARTRTISDELILETARVVFLEEGNQATTASIARRAGISEATIFKRFATKEELMFAVFKIPYPPPWHETLNVLVGTGDIKENFITIGVELLQYFQQVIPNMIVSSGIKIPPPPPLRKDFDEDAPLIKDMMKMRLFFQRELELGRIRNVDIDLLTTQFFWSFSSPVLQYVFKKAFNKDIMSDEDLRDLSKKTVDILWNGISCDG